MSRKVHIGFVFVEDVHHFVILLVGNRSFKVYIVVQQIFHRGRHVAVFIFLIIVPSQCPNHLDAEFVQNSRHLKRVAGTHSKHSRQAFELFLNFFYLRKINGTLFGNVFFYLVFAVGNTAYFAQPSFKTRDAALID